MKIKEIDTAINAAIKEDLPKGDITSESIIPRASTSEAILLAKEDGVLAGIHVAQRVFKKIDSSVKFKKIFKDGQAFKKGDVLAEIKGNSISLLKGERTALNFLQRLSGIATMTRRFVEVVAGTPAQILDTRKTTPGLRALEKDAVRTGGGVNHRLNLSTMVLIKDNHLMFIGSIPEAIRRAREKVKRGIKIEVEVTGFKEAREAVESGADIIMLDNMPLLKMKEIVNWVNGRARIEASGNISLENVRAIAGLGVDFISVGKLTHSFVSIDLSLEFLKD
ncbi:MAG: carboxylating nicotinate-nucleotide diphosphorylase [Candidatus Aminicenantales bacterium]